MIRYTKKRPLKEADAEEFVVRIDCKGPDGITYDVISYADEETDIDYERGIYGYDNDIRANVHPMTRANATLLATEVSENAPAGDVLVGVVPYSTIPNDEFAEDSDETAPDEFDDSELDDSELDDSELDDSEEEEESMEESIARAKNQLRKIQERVLTKAKNRKLQRN